VPWSSVSSMTKEILSCLMSTLRALDSSPSSMLVTSVPLTRMDMVWVVPRTAMVHVPSKRVSLGSVILWWRPSTQTARIWASSLADAPRPARPPRRGRAGSAASASSLDAPSALGLSSAFAADFWSGFWKSGAEVMTRLAALPSAMVPRVSETPRSSAGLVVSMARAWSAVRPFLMALVRLSWNFWSRGSLEEVRLTCRPRSARKRALEGASSQAERSSRLTPSAAPTDQTSGVSGKFRGMMRGRAAWARASRRLYSVPEPRMARRSTPISRAMESPRRASISQVLS
jgi:hypothetical protein